MKRKNIYLLKTIMLIGVIAAPSFYLLSSHNPRIPAGKRPLGYKGPKNVKQKRIQTTPATTPSDEVTSSAARQKKPEQFIEKQQPTETPEPETQEPEVISQETAAQAAVPAPGWFARMYATVAPIILVTLNESLGTGIASGTKSLIKEFVKKPELVSLKQQSENQLAQLAQKYSTALKLGDIEAIPAKDQEKLEKNMMLIQTIEKRTSIPSMLSNAVYIGALNTIIPMLASFIKLGTAITLQQFMPVMPAQK